jgi:S-(hydroxymethyl)glutathione dehydrogenase/alcohol dehydrogenase
VCRAAGQPLTIEEIVVDPPKAYEIRIKIICTSLCHTDITIWQAKVKACLRAQCLVPCLPVYLQILIKPTVFPYDSILTSSVQVAAVFPRILGHEAYGYVILLVGNTPILARHIDRLLTTSWRGCRVVESVGEHVEGFAAGDPVVPTLLGQCDHCPSCASEDNNLCSSVPVTLAPGMRRDGTTRFRDAQGSPVHDLLAVSSFSEYTVVDVNQVVKVDPAVPPKLACLLSCGAGTGEPAWIVHLSLKMLFSTEGEYFH